MARRGNRRIDRILDPAFLEGLSDLPLEALRAKREECEEEENVLSFERRLLHGRLDIIRAERERRATGAPPSSLIERLPEILADDTRDHRGSFPRQEAPPIFENPRRRVEKLVASDTLARLPDLTEDEIGRVTTALDEAEHEVSESRRAVQVVLDALVAEIGRRVGVDA